MLYPSPSHMDAGDECVAFMVGTIAAAFQHHAGRLSNENFPGVEYREKQRELQRQQKAHHQRGQRLTWQDRPDEPAKSSRTRRGNRGTKNAQAEMEYAELTAQESHALKRLSQLCHYCFDLPVAKILQQHLGAFWCRLYTTKTGFQWLLNRISYYSTPLIKFYHQA